MTHILQISSEDFSLQSKGKLRKVEDDSVLLDAYSQAVVPGSYSLTLKAVLFCVSIVGGSITIVRAP